MSAETRLPVLPMASLPGAPARAPAARARFVRRARQLAWVGLGWHLIEAAVALAAGVAAGSVALIGFGADSLIEAAAGIVVLWLMTSTRSSSPTAERRAQQLIAASFVVLAAYIGIEAIRDLAGGHRPDASWVGIMLSVVTLAAMPPLAAGKRRVGEQLGSSATTSESRQTMLCAYLSGALLIGLLANAALGWWWADPLVALAIAAVATREARDSVNRS
jgi:divalent metal cation (Fe/Co/Zn/Cd) transporter